MKVGNTYVQFSKVMVMIVLIAVTALAAVSLAGMSSTGDYAEVPALFAHYTDFAAVVFVAYSGNSVAEKWLVSGGHTDKPPESGPVPDAVG